MKSRALDFARGWSLAGALLVLLAVGFLAPDAVSAAKRAPAKAAAKSSTRRGGGAANDSNTVLVRIGNESITRGDVQRRIETLPEQFRANYSTPEGRQQLLDRMVEERVWLALATKNGVAGRPAVKQQLDQQRRDLLVRTYLNEVMATNPTPSDSEAQAYYDEHLAEYRIPATVTVKHIQTATENDAKRVKQFAKPKKADWDALVKRYSTDKETQASGGNLGTVTREGVFAAIGAQPALAESAFALGEGGIGGPIKTNKGWHVIKVETLKAESTRPFDQVRQVIVRQLGSKRSQDYYKERLDQARRSLGVSADSAAIKNFSSQKKTPREQFNEAQALTAPDARVDAYRKLLVEYPNSDVSPQAQFMIGFIYSEELKNYDEAEKAFRELLARYPKAELAASAQWMIEHMRSEEAPAFINLDSDSTSAASSEAPVSPRPRAWTPPKKGSAKKP